MFRRARAAEVAGLAAGLLLLSGCAGVSDAAARLGSAVDQQADGAGTLDLADVYQAGWDSFLIYCPYETPADVNQELGFVWSDAPDLSLDDEHQVLVFVTSAKVTESVVLDRSKIDFCDVSDWSLSTRGSEIPMKHQSSSGVWVAAAE